MANKVLIRIIIYLFYFQKNLVVVLEVICELSVGGVPAVASQSWVTFAKGPYNTSLLTVFFPIHYHPNQILLPIAERNEFNLNNHMYPLDTPIKESVEYYSHSPPLFFCLFVDKHI